MLTEETKLSELAPFLKEDAEFFAEQLSYYVGEYIDPTYMLISFEGPETVKKGKPYAEVGILFEKKNSNVGRGCFEFASDMKNKKKFLELKGNRNIDVIRQVDQNSKSLITGERRYYISYRHGSYIIIRTKLKQDSPRNRLRLAYMMYSPYMNKHLQLVNEGSLKLAAFLFPKVYMRFYTDIEKTLHDYDDYGAQILCNKKYRDYDASNNVKFKSYDLEESLINEFTVNDSYKLLPSDDIYYSKYNKYCVGILIPTDRKPKPYASDIKQVMKILHQDIDTFSLNSILCVYGIEDAEKYLLSIPPEMLLLLYDITKDKRLKYYIFTGESLKDTLWTEDELKAINVTYRADGMHYRPNKSLRCNCGRRVVSFRYHDEESGEYIPVCSQYCIDKYKSRKSEVETELFELQDQEDVEEF